MTQEPDFIFLTISDQLGKERTVFYEKSQTHKTCLGACKTQTYSLLVTDANYPTEATFKYTKQYCFVVLKLLKSCSTRRQSLEHFNSTLCQLIDKIEAIYPDWYSVSYSDFCPDYKWQGKKIFTNKNERDSFDKLMYDYSRKNIALVNLFIREPFAKEILTSVKTTRLAFVSDLGGLLGLFMGFSFVSIFEILFHACKVI